MLRTSHQHNQKHFILGVSLAVTLAQAHGRSKTFGMRRVNQQVSALALGSGSTFYFRWIPSEWKPADLPLRGGHVSSVPVRELASPASTSTRAAAVDHNGSGAVVRVKRMGWAFWESGSAALNGSSWKPPGSQEPSRKDAWGHLIHI